jgi:hypothetical protein
MTPLGTALLGLQVGDRMPYKASDAQSDHEVMVEGLGLRFVGEGMPSRNIQRELPEQRGRGARGAPH